MMVGEHTYPNNAIVSIVTRHVVVLSVPPPAHRGSTSPATPRCHGSGRMIWSNLERISGWATEQRSGGAEDAVKTSPSSSRCPHRSSAIRRHCGSVRQVSAAAAVETGSLGA